jgi:hypothetical protein
VAGSRFSIELGEEISSEFNKEHFDAKSKIIPSKASIRIILMFFLAALLNIIFFDINFIYPFPYYKGISNI